MDYSQVDLFKSDTLSQRYLSIFLQGISGIFYTFLNPQFIFPLISHLKRPTLKRVNYIFRMAHIEEVVIYLLIAICGYLLLAQHRDILPISPLIITSISIAPLVLGKQYNIKEK
jgi:amino acid permease